MMCIYIRNRMDGRSQEQQEFKHEEIPCIGLPECQIDKGADDAEEDRGTIRSSHGNCFNAAQACKDHLGIKQGRTQMEIDRIKAAVSIDDGLERIGNLMLIRLNQLIQVERAVPKGGYVLP